MIGFPPMELWAEDMGVAFRSVTKMPLFPPSLTISNPEDLEEKSKGLEDGKASCERKLVC